jgi:hypothetical protein
VTPEDAFRGIHCLSPNALLAKLILLIKLFFLFIKKKFKKEEKWLLVTNLQPQCHRKLHGRQTLHDPRVVHFALALYARS